MRKGINIICLLVLSVFCFISICYSQSQSKDMKQKKPNRLKKLYFVPKLDIIVGICSSEPNGTIRFWAIDDGKLRDVLDLGKGEWASSLSVSNDGSSIAIALLDKSEIGCYSLAERKWLWKTKWVEKGLVDNPMGFAPNDQKLLVVGFRNIVTYDSKTGSILQMQEDSKGFSSGFPNYRTRNNTISPSTRYAAFWQGYLEHDETWWSSRNIWVLVRDIEAGKVVAKQGKIQKKYKNCSAVFTPDENYLVLGSMDGYIRVWSITGQKVIGGWRAYWHEGASTFEENPAPNEIGSIIFSPAGKYLATMGRLKGKSAVRIWNYATYKLIHEFDNVISSPLPMCFGYPMAFSPDGKYFALEQQGNLCLYDTQTWQEKWCVPSLEESK